MTAAMIISGTVGWFVLAAGVSPRAAVFWRCLFGALAAVCGWLGQLRRGLLSRRQAGLCVLGGVALALNWTLLFGAYGHASISVATIVYHTQPFMLVALGALCFKEKPGARKLACLALAFGGLAAIVVAAGSGFACGRLVRHRRRAGPGRRVLLRDRRHHRQGLEGRAAASDRADPASHRRGADVALGRPARPAARLGPACRDRRGPHRPDVDAALQRAAKTATSLIGVLSFIYPIVAMLVDALAFDQRMNAIQIAGAALILLSAAAMNRPARAGGPAEADVDRQS